VTSMTHLWHTLGTPEGWDTGMDRPPYALLLALSLPLITHLCTSLHISAHLYLRPYALIIVHLIMELFLFGRRRASTFLFIATVSGIGR